MKTTFISIGWGTAIVSVVVFQWYRLVLAAIQAKAADGATEENAADGCDDVESESVPTKSRARE